jgi:hypothetical protein
VTRSQSKPKPAPVEAAPDDAKKPGKSWRSRITIAALVAVVALLGSSLDLLYRVFPSLKKDPGNEHAAEIAVLTMDPNVTYGSYRRRPNASTMAGTDPTANGNVFYLQMQMHGFKGSSARLRWYTYNDDNHERLGAPFSTGRNFRAKAPSNKTISEEWVPARARTSIVSPLHHYRIRFELYDSDDVLLAYADSAKFTAG